MKYILLFLLACSSATVFAEADKSHHSILFGYGAMPMAGEADFTTFQYEYIFDSNTGVSLNYIDIDHSIGGFDEYQVDVVTLKITQYFQLSENFYVYLGASYGQATPTFFEPKESQDSLIAELNQDKVAEAYFDKENGYSYTFGFRHHIAANIYWGIGYEAYKMGIYEPPVDVNLSISYRF